MRSYLGDLFDRRELQYFYGHGNNPSRAPFLSSLDSQNLPSKCLDLGRAMDIHQQQHANTELTLSDRGSCLHCNSSFWKSSNVICTPSRKALFGRLGVEEIANRIVKLDLDLLSDEQNNQIAWLEANI